MKTDSRTEPLYLDDLQVGQAFLSGEHRLDAEQIVAFAAQFDPQPFHLDPEAARETFFQGLAASGWHTMAITMKLLVQSIPLAQGIIGAGGEISWPRPTRPGDVLRVKSRIAEIKPSRSRPDRAMVMAHSLTLNQADEVLQDFTARLLVFRKET
ncbi:MaoC family dehydratase [Paracoccus denitrificans]|jgi:acyl dehydratase|uniref:MaoC domain protein dehydratase n=1 Tax=Paracoccus denitrificans (strain Pd 1222) TaxID=318586 RepID=A1BB47_PARDP|nr:MaoC family dehydratase [Paracoccus denitrificans]ABL72741.1 MaoC domain protein dehydratase [Paracoccus denitrificans PD1222]MBB4626219.1 acyl dehydratase [Paracoccus denitrificans]MCU7427573.1 MaoC family dehydratase [Paracoccus denitrificans]QAR29705.1 MaoC family dehydratase [Paracoccus denitrificans]UFS68403.1 MaoC family dehydratase [Paracoccus denitrificans]